MYAVENARGSSLSIFFSSISNISCSLYIQLLVPYQTGSETTCLPGMCHSGSSLYFPEVKFPEQMKGNVTKHGVLFL